MRVVALFVGQTVCVNGVIVPVNQSTAVHVRIAVRATGIINLKGSVNLYSIQPGEASVRTVPPTTIRELVDAVVRCSELCSPRTLHELKPIKISRRDLVAEIGGARAHAGVVYALHLIERKERTTFLPSAP